MKKKITTHKILIVFMSIALFGVALSNPASNAHVVTQAVIQDSVMIDTLEFEDMWNEYTIVRYTIGDNIVQLNVDRKESYTQFDYIIWDMDKDGMVESVGVYDVLDQKYNYYVLEEPLYADELLEYSIQIEEIGFPSFYDSSAVPKAVYKSEEHQPVLNYYKWEDLIIHLAM